MRTFRTIGIASTIAVFLLSGGVALANEGQVKQATSTRSENENSNARMLSASTTAARIQSMRDEAQKRMAEQRSKAAEHLSNIQDKVKKEMAKAFVMQFDNLNAAWTDKFTQQLDHYDALVAKMQARATVASNAGKDVTATMAAIQSAKAALATARTAVAAQAIKTYTLDPSTIPTTATSTRSGQEKLMQSLRMSFQKLHLELFKDLFALRDGVMKDARKAVQNAVQTLSAIPHVDEDTATSTRSGPKQ